MLVVFLMLFVVLLRRSSLSLCFHRIWARYKRRQTFQQLVQQFAPVQQPFDFHADFRTFIGCLLECAIVPVQ